MKVEKVLEKALEICKQKIDVISIEISFENEIECNRKSMRLLVFYRKKECSSNFTASVFDRLDNYSLKGLFFELKKELAEVVLELKNEELTLVV